VSECEERLQRLSVDKHSSLFSLQLAMKEIFIKIVSRGTSYLIFLLVVSKCEESLLRLSSDKHSSLFSLQLAMKEFFIKIVSRGTAQLILQSIHRG
jgi:hypothetical protein